jgi:hypothetical protein
VAGTCCGAFLASPDWFKLYVGLQASASRICTYDGEIVPGELHTQQYALAVFGPSSRRDRAARPGCRAVAPSPAVSRAEGTA